MIRDIKKCENVCRKACPHIILMCGRLADAAVSEGFQVGTVDWRLTE